MGMTTSGETLAGYARDVPEMHDKGCWQPLLLTVTSLGLAVRGVVKQARRALSRHQIERGTTGDEVLVIPAPHQGPLALDPQSDM